MPKIAPPPQQIPRKILNDKELAGYFLDLNRTIFQLWFFIAGENGLLSDPPSGYTTFANLSTDRTLNADSTTLAEVADVLGTLIEDLKATTLITE